MTKIEVIRKASKRPCRYTKNRYAVCGPYSSGKVAMSDGERIFGALRKAGYKIRWGQFRSPRIGGKHYNRIKI